MPAEARLVGPYERLVLLKAVLMSGNPPIEALAALALQAGERRLAVGASITYSGSHWEHAFVVVHGRVGVHQDGQLLYSAGPMEAFGLLEVLARDAGVVEARAESETLVLQLSATTLLSVLEDHFVMTLDMIRALARLLLATPSWLVDTVDRRRLAVPSVVSMENLDLIDRINLLRASDVFARTRLDSLAELATDSDEFRVDAGAVLWREGEPSSWLVVVLDGRIASASTLGLRFAWGPGTIPGMADAFAAAPRWHDAIAETPVTGLRLSAERFFDALEDDFEMATDVLTALAAQARQQQQALVGSPPPGLDTQD